MYVLNSNMKNKLLPMWDKILMRKRYIIECINDLLKIKANLVHFPASVDTQFHHESMCSTLAAYCFFDNKDPFRDF